MNLEQAQERLKAPQSAPSPLRETLDWLVSRPMRNRRKQARLIALCTAAVLGLAHEPKQNPDALCAVLAYVNRLAKDAEI